MRIQRFQPQFLLFSLMPCAIAVSLTGCGGLTPVAGSAAQSSSVTSVSVSCAPSDVAPGGTTQCSAAVQGTGAYSPTVAWSASAGSITPAGIFTAPAAAQSVTVTATSVQDSGLTGSATVSVGTGGAPGSSVTSVTVSCSPAAVNTGSTSQCSAVVEGIGSYSSAVTWSATGGAISPGGVFTAPAVEGDVVVTATSTQDSAQSGDATLVVQLAVPASHHVVWVMEENQSYSTVVGQTAVWPNLNNLIDEGALPTNYYADSHPSIGNYFMLTTGQTLTTNDNSTTVWNVDNIARRMLAEHLPFRIYAEGITQGYVGGNTGSISSATIPSPCYPTWPAIPRSPIR